MTTNSSTLPASLFPKTLAVLTGLGLALATLDAPAAAQTASAVPVADKVAPAPKKVDTDRPENMADLVARLLPSVVSIATTQGSGPDPAGDAKPGAPFDEYFKDYFNDRRGNRRGSAVGSGFVIDPTGYIVTNNHVITQATEVKVILSDGRKLDAKIIGKDPRADLALLKVEPTSPLPAVTWGPSESMRVGDTVVAIGNPFGLGGTVTRGIISARHRHLRNFGGYSGNSFVSFLQTDAAINKGNSGGPLFNLKGEVIGINTAIYSRGGTNVGIAFAVPSNTAQPIIDQLRKFGRTKRGWLGVRIQDVDEEIAKTMGLERPRGALVANVVDSSPAAKGGILTGDVIIRFDGKPVRDSQALPLIVAGTAVGKEVAVTVIRRKEEKVLTVTLGELETAEKTETPDSKPAPNASNELPELGLTVAKITPQLVEKYKLPGQEGVVVTAVDPNSAAWSKEIRPGDVILEFDMTKINTPEEAKKQLAKAKEARKSSSLLLVQKGKDRRFVVVRFAQPRNQ